MSAPLAFYAHATLVLTPWTDSDRALRFIHAQRPDFVALRTADRAQMSYADDWLRGGVPDDCAKFVHEIGDGTEVLRIYTWSCD